MISSYQLIIFGLLSCITCFYGAKLVGALTFPSRYKTTSGTLVDVRISEVDLFSTKKTKRRMILFYTYIIDGVTHGSNRLYSDNSSGITSGFHKVKLKFDSGDHHINVYIKNGDPRQSCLLKPSIKPAFGFIFFSAMSILSILWG